MYLLLYPTDSNETVLLFFLANIITIKEINMVEKIIKDKCLFESSAIK